MLIFMVGHGIYEWPDGFDQVEKSLLGDSYYPLAIGIESKHHGIENSGIHKFFSDTNMYKVDQMPIWLNIYRAPFVLLFILFLFFIAYKINSKIFAFSPPLIFALAQPSQEALAIFVLVTGLIILEKWPKLAIIILISSTIVDRSMVPNALALIIYRYFIPLRGLLENYKSGILIALVLLLATRYIAPYEVLGSVLPAGFEFYSISLDDINYNSEYGGNNIYALAASLMGLYGWMSIRPQPFVIYYTLIGLLFMNGLFKANKQLMGLFWLALITSILTMWLLPPLSQARYYPLLCLVFWRLITDGLRDFSKENKILASTAVIAMTAIGLMMPLLNI